jgi:hypothetical protein
VCRLLSVLVIILEVRVPDPSYAGAAGSDSGPRTRGGAGFQHSRTAARAHRGSDALVAGARAAAASPQPARGRLWRPGRGAAVHPGAGPAADAGPRRHRRGGGQAAVRRAVAPAAPRARAGARVPARPAAGRVGPSGFGAGGWRVELPHD